MPLTTNEKIDRVTSIAQRSPEAIAALAYIAEKEALQQATLRRGPRKTPVTPAVARAQAAQAAAARASARATAGRAATTRSIARKVAAPAELGFHALEAARLVSSPEVRGSRVGEAEDLAKKGTARRLVAAVDNPVGLIYGTGALLKETYDTNNDPRIKAQDAAYFQWLAKRRAATLAAKAQEAGAQQKSRSSMIRDMVGRNRMRPNLLTTKD
jgi:hypothetical protein